MENNNLTEKNVNQVILVSILALLLLIGINGYQMVKSITKPTEFEQYAHYSTTHLLKLNAKKESDLKTNMQKAKNIDNTKANHKVFHINGELEMIKKVLHQRKIE